MIAALNLIVPVVVIGFVLLAMRLKKMFPIYTAIVFVILYALLQPSYLPKGTVKPVVYEEFKPNESVFVDRMLKPKSGAERDASRKAEFEKNDERIDKLIKQMKTEKGVN